MFKFNKPRRYYSLRKAGDPTTPFLDLDGLKGLVLAMYRQLDAEGYLTEAFGFTCADDGEVWGTVGSDIQAYMQLHTRKPYLWPVRNDLLSDMFDEEDFFDLIEFLFDHVSKPTVGQMHSYGNCGMHWSEFDKTAGQAEYRDAVSDLLEHYGVGFELNELGEILERAPKGIDKLLKAAPPTKDPSLRGRLNAAILSFQRHRSSLDDRRHAVRDLADILEMLRPQMKEVLHRKDEGDLFNIANNFSIRHADEKQKSDYDPAVWLSWMFYFYLATINACLHLLERKEKK